MKFTWTAQGTEIPSSSGAMERAYEESGTIEAESAGEVVEWLAHSSPIWDGIDQDRAMTIEIVPTS